MVKESKSVYESGDMGITHVEGSVRGDKGQEKQFRFLVDSGASYTVLPNRVWRSLGLEARRELVFTGADGSTVYRGVSECYLALSQREAHTPVVLGELDDEALLGVVILEILGLLLNPFTRTLLPMRMLLA